MSGKFEVIGGNLHWWSPRNECYTCTGIMANMTAEDWCEAMDADRDWPDEGEEELPLAA